MMRRADCWAAERLLPNELDATIELLRDSSQQEGLRIYGDPQKRADLMPECVESIENGKSLVWKQ